MKPLVRPPKAELLYEATVDVDAIRSLGMGPLGERRIVNILGGEFIGPGAHGIALRGKVLPGGADRQLVQANGVRQLEALYEMETDDGVVLTVRNNVKIVDPPGAERQAFSHVVLNAPQGRYGWLNDTVMVGTVHPLMPARQAVLITIFRLC